MKYLPESDQFMVQTCAARISDRRTSANRIFIVEDNKLFRHFIHNIRLYVYNIYT